MKLITKVFLVIAALVFSLVIWGLFFNSGGVLETGYNALISPINSTWQAISGTSNNLVPEWTISGTENLDVDGNRGQAGGTGTGAGETQ